MSTTATLSRYIAAGTGYALVLSIVYLIFMVKWGLKRQSLMNVLIIGSAYAFTLGLLGFLAVSSPYTVFSAVALLALGSGVGYVIKGGQSSYNTPLVTSPFHVVCNPILLGWAGAAVGAAYLSSGPVASFGSTADAAIFAGFVGFSAGRLLQLSPPLHSLKAIFSGGGDDSIPPQHDMVPQPVGGEPTPRDRGNSSSTTSSSKSNHSSSSSSTAKETTNETQNQQHSPSKKPTGGHSTLDESSESAGIDELKELVAESQFPWERPPSTSFQDIGGYRPVKKSLTEEVLAPLTEEASAYERFDIEPARGILFHGPPGTGKTLFARGLAGELNRPFVEIDTATLTSKLVNETPDLIKSLLREANALGGVVFIDEAEQLFGDRGGTNQHQEDSKATSTFLSELTKEDINYIVIATTNRRDDMDDAMLRPGRLDNHYEIGEPDETARIEIIQTLVRGIPHQLSEDEITELAANTSGDTGADLDDLLHTARLNAAQADADTLTLDHFPKSVRENL